MDTSIIYIALAFFAYILYHQIRTVFEYKSAEKRATVPVSARVVEVHEEERWETERNMVNDRLESVKKIVLIPIWEYEVNGATYKGPASASEGVPIAREGDTATLYIDPATPWEPWHAIGKDQYGAITQTIVLAAAFVGIVSLMAFTSVPKLLVIGAAAVLAWSLIFRFRRRMYKASARRATKC
jgi:hypothetical protein